MANNWIGVITGDIVNSTQIMEAGYRDELLSTLRQTIKDANKRKSFGHLSLEIFRGDSFQIRASKLSNVLDVALLVRSALIAGSRNKERWDARLGIGIGTEEYQADTLAESNGEAYRLSGKAFENLDRNTRLAIITTDDDFNGELQVTTAFVDDIINNWTIVQANLIYSFILGGFSQKELAEKEGKSQQAVSKVLLNGKMHLIADYMVRFLKKMDQLL